MWACMVGTYRCHSPGDFPPRSPSFRPTYQLATAIRADVLHSRRACIAKSAFVIANHRHAVRRQRLLALLAFSFHLQSHGFVLYRIRMFTKYGLPNSVMSPVFLPVTGSRRAERGLELLAMFSFLKFRNKIDGDQIPEIVAIFF